MVFSSIVFLVYFLPALLATYYLADKKYKNVVLLVFSVFFYSWGAPKFIFVILATTILDFMLVSRMATIENLFYRRLMLIISVSVNLGLLFYFKYSNFFVENVNTLLAAVGIHGIHWTKLVLPIGISFYTFETITYVVDVYRRVHKPLKNFWDYQLYIILFPKLIAGPIIRYHELADQISDRTAHDTIDNRLTGFYRFVIGLSKKVFIANYMGQQADAIFGLTDYGSITSSQAWIGILCYTFQIYFDFSGYSDMAIGLGKMLGFRFPENFNNPYIANSITDFWRRWHITLGSWMRNYLYIPLGGNRVNKTRLYFNLWLVFLLSGLWHGASWNFVLWGAYHGVFLVLERAFLLRVYNRLGKWLSVFITFILVIIGWVFFRVETVSDALVFISRMFSFRFDALHFDAQFYVYLLLAFLFAFFTIIKKGEKIQQLIYFENYTNARHIVMTVLCMFLFVLAVGAITTTGFNPFIYFRF